MERPQVMHAAGQYHLFFNCWARYVNPDWARQHLPPGSKPTDDSLYHFVAASAEGPFRPSATTPIVPGSPGTRLYGLRFVPLGAIWHLMGWHLEEFSLEVSGRWRMTFQGSDPRVEPNPAWDTTVLPRLPRASRFGARGAHGGAR